MRENRLSGLMRGGSLAVIGCKSSHSVGSCLLYTSALQISLRSRSAALIRQLDWPLAPATPAEDLQDHDRKCVDNLRPLKRGVYRDKASRTSKNKETRRSARKIALVPPSETLTKTN